MLFYAQKMPKKDLFAHASQYCNCNSTRRVVSQNWQGNSAIGPAAEDGRCLG
jgi:hypothetical protein